MGTLRILRSNRWVFLLSLGILHCGGEADDAGGEAGAAGGSATNVAAGGKSPSSDASAGTAQGLNAGATSTGGSDAASTGGSAIASTGGSSTTSTGGSGAASTGGSGAASPGGAGTTSTGGAGAASTGGSGAASTGGSIDCSTAGCAAPPFCTVGCTEVCGCCTCAEGDSEVIDGVPYECAGGCWAEPLVTCEYNGGLLNVGDRVWGSDGCNICTCSSAGDLSCTESGCSCDPASEINVREYLETTAIGCELVAEFNCPTGGTAFMNPCGCGCEQPPDCPTFYDCMPTVDDPDNAYCATLPERCPYTEIVW